MLTKSLSMPGFIALIAGTYNGQLKCIYLKNQKPFVNILIPFQNLHKILNIVKKKLSLIA